MIKRNNLVYNVSSINEYGVDKNINQPMQVVVKDVILISDYKLKIIYNYGATKDIELVNNSIKKFEYVSEGNKIIIETNNNDKFEIEIPIDGSKWELVEGLLRTKDGSKITLQDINEIDSVLGAEDKFLNKKGEFRTIQTSSIGVTGSELYMSAQDSDIAGYKLLSNTIDANETEITLTANSSKGIVWGNKYLTPEYTATTIPAKSWGFDYWRKVSNSLNNSTKHLRVFIYRGGIETDIISLTSPDINDTNFVERQVAYTLGAIELQQGDRIGVQEGFSTTRVQDVTLTFIIGDGRGWFMRVPLALSHKDTTDKNAEPEFQHVTQEEKDLISSTATIVSGHTEDISELQTNKVDKATTLSGYGITDAYTKTEINSKISAVFRYKGSIPTYVDLTALTGMTVGDVYNVTETGDNYAWTGTEWDKLSGEIDLSAYLTIIDASNTYETKLNVNSLSNIVSGHTEDISNLETNKADKSTTLSGYGITDAYTKDEIDTSFENHKTYSNVTYNDLLALINNNELVPNSSYRITNYTTKTSQTDTQSAGHDFDIIVTALSTNKLSEIASCVRKSGDTYFANADLEAWEIKYCINNDTSRFAWADTVNGKGVIYYMKDEWNNECPYDFKNIQFKRYPILSMPNGSTSLVFNTNTQKTKYALKDSDGVIVPTGAVIDENNASYYFTFNAILQGSATYDVYDASVIQKGIKNSEGGDFIVQNNKINEAHTTFNKTYKYGQILKLNNIVINNIVNSLVYTGLSEGCHSNTFDNDCYYITFGNSCYANSFGIKCDSNTFGNGCYYNIFGNGFDSNTFGNNCNSNVFGDKCDTNTFGDSSYYNTFGNGCDSNTFGSSCVSNTLGNNCNYNTLGNNCNYNTFGDNSNSNTFDIMCSYNTFGSYCNSNMFGIKCDYNKFGNYCYNNNFYAGTSGTTKKDYIRYIVLEDGCTYNNFYSSVLTSSSSYLQRIRIKGLNYNTPTNIQITLSETNTNYNWVIAGDLSGVIKQYCPEDSSFKGNYDAETVSAPANAGTLTLKNATETVISTTLTNSNSFTIALPTATAGKVNESILIFKTGATLPTLTQPNGVVYRTETPVIAINQTWTLCYERVSFDNGSTFEIYVSATKNV